jgi:hypothetical protein
MVLIKEYSEILEGNKSSPKKAPNEWFGWAALLDSLLIGQTLRESVLWCYSMKTTVRISFLRLLLVKILWSGSNLQLLLLAFHIMNCVLYVQHDNVHAYPSPGRGGVSACKLFLTIYAPPLMPFCPKKVSNQGPGPTPRNGLARIKHFTHGAV